MTTRHPALTAQKLGPLALANRLAVAPMTRVSATPDGDATTEMADYYATFASGGFGLVITEGIYTDTAHSQGYLNQPGLATDVHVRAWRPAVDAVHAHGAPIVAQLMHAGALSQGNSYGRHTIAPSAITPRGKQLEEYGGSGDWPTPVAMTSAEIETVTAAFAAAAVRAREAGFDGVEVHAANGYLLDQFLTDYTNARDDQYGGDTVNRVRLTAEVLTAVRTALGPDFLVGVRLSQTKVNDFTHRWAGGATEAEIIFGALAGTGVDYLHIASEGRNFIDTARFSDGRTITALARTVTGLPVLANGGMHDLQQAADVLDGGHADLLTLGRGALANPDLPLKVSAGVDLDTFDHAMLSPMATLGNTPRLDGRPVSWHGGAAAVATLTFDVDAESPILAQGGHYADHMMVMSHQSYGPDVGVPRILDMLAELGVAATFFMPGWVAEQRPGLAARIVDHGHEVAHHSYSHRSPVTMTAAEERADFERALEVFAAQRIEIAGHRAALWGASWQTPELIASHGLTYDSSLMGDDRPYRIATGGGPIVELPVHWSLDDWEQYAFLPDPHIGAVIESPLKVAEMWRAELDAMRRYRCLFNLCVHPFLSGRPSRIVALRGLIEEALELGDVSFMRCRDLAAAVDADADIAPRRLAPPQGYP